MKKFLHIHLNRLATKSQVQSINMEEQCNCEDSLTFQAAHTVTKTTYNILFKQIFRTVQLPV